MLAALVAAVIGNNGRNIGTGFAGQLLTGFHQPFLAASGNEQFGFLARQRQRCAAAQSGAAAIDQSLLAGDSQIHMASILKGDGDLLAAAGRPAD